MRKNNEKEERRGAVGVLISSRLSAIAGPREQLPLFLILVRGCWLLAMDNCKNISGWSR
jgi:hypothetical protein